VGYDSEVFIQRVIELLLNPERQAAMSKAAREYALGISWDSIFEKVYVAYGHALRPGVRRASIITTDASRTRR
jgi:hypothetical protein